MIDPRAAYYVPKSLKKLICHGTFIPVEFRAKRQVEQATERRGQMDLEVDFVNKQEGKRLFEGVGDESVDVVMMLQISEDAAKSDLASSWLVALLSETGRVLRPGGRILFVEKKDVKVDREIDFVSAMQGLRMDGSYKLFAAGEEEGDENDSEKSMEEVDLQKYSLFDVAYDSIDLCPSPHYAGVAIKRSAKEEEEVEEVREKREMTMGERMKYEKRVKGAELAIEAFERGRKKKKRGKKGQQQEEEELAKAKKEEKDNANPIEKLRRMVTGEK